jgi:hypothetical protein
MNQRIRELHSQCKVCDKDTVLYFDYEKFALLIVRECAELFDKDEIELTLTERAIHSMIKEHFGEKL